MGRAFLRFEGDGEASEIKMDVPDGSNIAVWFSCGAASAVAAKLTIEKYGNANISVLNCFVAEEDADNRRFLKDVEKWLGLPITVLTSQKYPSGSCVDVWNSSGFMSSIHGAKCTVELKKEVRYAYQDANRVDFHVLGFTAEEEARYRNFILSECPNTLPVLIEAGVTKKDCYGIIADAGIELPAIYLRGYPNANCIGCVKATSPTYWNHVRQADPAVFEARAVQSRQIGARLVRVKGERIFLDELKLTDTGRPMKNMDFECGVFCTPEKIVKENDMANDLVFKIHSMGLTTVPSSDNPTMPEYKKYLGELLNLETGLTVAVRFEIGNTLLEVPLEHGEKFAFCEKHFGERAVFMMECMKIAREWVHDQGVGWSWSHYKLTYARSKEQKIELIKQYKQKKIRTVEHIKAVLQRWDEDTQNARISAKRDQIVHVDDLLQPDNNVIEAELKPHAPAIAPPPNTVNPGPWCECGEPALPDSKFCSACWKVYRERDVQKHASDPVADFFSHPQPAVQIVSGTSFKVEGETVTQQPFERSTAVVKQTPPISTTEPVAVAFNPLTGVITYQACSVRKVESPQGFAVLAILGDGRQVEVFIPCSMMPEEA